MSINLYAASLSQFMELFYQEYKRLFFILARTGEWKDHTLVKLCQEHNFQIIYFACDPAHAGPAYKLERRTPAGEHYWIEQFEMPEYSRKERL